MTNEWLFCFFIRDAVSTYVLLKPPALTPRRTA